MVIGNWPWTWSGRCLLALVVVGGLMAATASQAEARGRGRILQRLRPQATHRTVCANGVCQQVPVAASAVVPEKSFAAAPPAPPEGATKVAPEKSIAAAPPAPPEGATKVAPPAP